MGATDLKCPTCKTRVREGDRFCGACRCALAPRAEDVEPAAQPPPVENGPAWTPSPSPPRSVRAPIELAPETSDERDQDEEPERVPGFFEAADPPVEELRAAALHVRQVIEARLNASRGPLQKLKGLFGSQITLPPGRTEAEVRSALSWFNAGAGPTPALVVWFTCFDGGFSLYGTDDRQGVHSLDEAVAQRKQIANMAGKDVRSRVYLRRTDFLPIAGNGSGDNYIYETKIGRRGIAFDDHECQDAPDAEVEDIEFDGSSWLVFLADLERRWTGK